MRGAFRKLTGCPNCTLAVFGVAFAAAITVLFLGDLHSRYREEIARAKQKAANQASILAADAVRGFHAVDRALRVAEIVYREAAGPYRTESERLAAQRRAAEALQQIQKTSPMIVGIGWTDAAGVLQVSSRELTTGPRDVSDRSYFMTQRDRTDAGLFVAPPFRSHATERWLTAASRRLSNPDGSFAGVVNATLDPAYFRGMYGSMHLGVSGTVMLFHRSGALITREPYIENAVGRQFDDGPVFSEYLAKGDAGSFEANGYFDGLPRIAGYKATPGLPLVVVVSVARAEVLASWYRHLGTFGPMTGFVVAVILFGTVLLMRQTRKIAEKSSVLELTLDNISQGLVMLDSEQRLIVCNRRYAEIYGFSPELIKPGTPLRSMLEVRAATGHSLPDGGDYVAARLAEAASRVPSQIINRLRDGRVIAVGHQPIPGDRVVRTHQDVTAEKRIEQSLIAKTDELKRANMLLDAALNNMSQGLCMFDATQHVVVANRRFREIYGLSIDQVKPGTTLRQLIEYRIAAGNYFGPDSAEYDKENPGKPSDMHTLEDGRVISLLRHDLPDGGWLTTYEDVTERQRNEAKVAFMAHHDLLTGLANRNLFMERVEEAGARLRRRGEAFAVFMLDLDRFKDVNDSLGHPAGDALLKEMAQRLKFALRETDVLARLGGDEFAILQGGEGEHTADAAALAARIIEIIARPFDLDGRKVGVGTSIGIALAPRDGVDPDELIKKADLALYRTKSLGRNGFNFFHADMTSEADARHQLESELREALSRNEFELHYQPVIDIATREPRGAEALVRWRHPVKGLIPPDRFISLAEDTGLIVPLGAWILQQACQDAASWPDHVKVAVNLSSVQFRKGDLFDIILCALVDAGLKPERLELEITESILLENEASYRSILRQLKNIGISIAIDDFGTGYSSLGYMTTFPVDKIKIDKSFTQGLAQRAECGAVVASVLTLARHLDIETTAEGVETEEQLDMLDAAGVTLAQGYLLGRPVPACSLSFYRAGADKRATTAA